MNHKGPRRTFILHTIRGKTRWYVNCLDYKTVPWARVVMQNHIGRELLPSEVVHHRNGDSEDDRLENLELFNNHAEHMRVEYERGVLSGLAIGPLFVKNRESDGKFTRSQVA